MPKHLLINVQPALSRNLLCLRSASSGMRLLIPMLVARLWGPSVEIQWMTLVISHACLKCHNALTSARTNFLATIHNPAPIVSHLKQDHAGCLLKMQSPGLCPCHRVAKRSRENDSTQAESLRVRLGICLCRKPPNSLLCQWKVEKHSRKVTERLLKLHSPPSAFTHGEECVNIWERQSTIQKHLLSVKGPRVQEIVMRNLRAKDEFHIQFICISFHVAQGWPADGVHWMLSLCLYVNLHLMGKAGRSIWFLFECCQNEFSFIILQITWYPWRKVLCIHTYTFGQHKERTCSLRLMVKRKKKK